VLSAIESLIGLPEGQGISAAIEWVFGGGSPEA
jgi:hypothetical protein